MFSYFFGNLTPSDFKDSSIIISFNEKTIGRNMWINNGHYIFQKEIFHKQEYKFSLENDLFPKLVSNGELGVFKVENDYFVDMGIPDDYHRLVNEITMRNNGN